MIEEDVRLAVATALLLLAAHLGRRLFVAWRQPPVIGEILGGLVLGPTGIAGCFPPFGIWLYPAEGPVAQGLDTLAGLGLVLLMYVAGSELRGFCRARERKLVLGISVVGTILPLGAGAAALGLFDWRPLLGPANHPTAFVLVFITAIAITSIPVISRILLDLGILETSFARVVLATAVVEDLVLYVLLAVAVGLVQSQGGAAAPLVIGLGLEGTVGPLVYHVLASALLLGATLKVGPLLWRALLRLPGGADVERAGAAQVLFLFLVIALASALGVTPMLGALAAGMVTGRLDSPVLGEARRTLGRVALALFLPLYFAQVGLRLDLVRAFDPGFFAGFLLFACLVKASSVYLGARLAGEPPPGAANFAIALNARGGPGIVLACVAFEAGIVAPSFYATLVMLAVVTSLTAGSWLGWCVRRQADSPVSCDARRAAPS